MLGPAARFRSVSSGTTILVDVDLALLALSRTPATAVPGVPAVAFSSSCLSASSRCATRLGVEIRRLSPFRGFIASVGEVSKLGMGMVEGPADRLGE